MQYLVEPMYVNVAMNFNTSYTPDYTSSPFRYNICTLVSDIKVNLNPRILTQVVGASASSIMRAYRDKLKKFRPRIRIQALLDKCGNGKRTAEMSRKIAICVRDQWRLVLWFVRLRRLAMTG